MDPLEKEWMFCPYSGNALTLDASKQIAYCEASGYRIALKGMSDMYIALIQYNDG